MMPVNRLFSFMKNDCYYLLFTMSCFVGFADIDDYIIIVRIFILPLGRNFSGVNKMTVSVFELCRDRLFTFGALSTYSYTSCTGCHQQGHTCRCSV